MSDAPRPSASLAEILGARALGARPARLVVDVAGGALVVAVASWARPAAWLMMASAGVCLLAYGAWAFALRRLHVEPWRLSRAVELGWRVLRAAAALVGLAAFVLLLLSLLGTVLGTWVS